MGSQWHQLDHMQVICTSKITMPTPHHLSSLHAKCSVTSKAGQKRRRLGVRNVGREWNQEEGGGDYGNMNNMRGWARSHYRRAFGG